MDPKKKTEIKQQLPKMNRNAEIKNSSFNEEDGTFDVVFSTGSEVKRGFWERYTETLSLDPQHVRMNRLENGAPFLNNHSAWSTNSVLGVIENAHVDGERGFAKIRLSNREGLEGIKKDIKDGILRNVSVGYAVHRYMDVSEKDDDGNVTKRILRAVDWEPMEISLVPIGADPDAQIRSQKEQEFFPVVIERSMMDPKSKQDPKTKSPDTADEPVKVDVEKLRKEEQEKSLQRAKDIRTSCRKAGLDEEFADNLVYNTEITVDEARKQIIDAMAERSEKSNISSNNVDIGGQDETVTRRDAVENALMHRYNPEKTKLTEHGKKYRHCSLLELARHAVSWSVEGSNVSYMSKNKITERALHGTSDFPIILENIATKTLRQGYEEAPQTFQPLVRRTSVSDFKEISRTQIGEAPALEKVNEHGEYKHGTIKEGGEKYKIETYGKIVGITRQTIINDDLDAFTRIPAAYGRQAANLESDLVWGIITGNPKMADGKNLFSNDHKNLATANEAISIAAIGKGREKIRKQKGVDKKTRISIPVRWLVVPIALETFAEQFLAISIRQNANNFDDFNPFAQTGRSALGLIVEERLDDVSLTAWYLTSSAQDIDIIELATLDGQAGPMIQTRNGWEVDGLQIKASYDVGAKAIDHRGIYKNPGA